MNKFIFISILLVFTGLGIFFYLYQESWFIIHFPSSMTAKNERAKLIKSQEIPVWIWYKNSLKKESLEIIVSDNTAQTLKILLNSWFALLEEENIIDKQITIQSVALSASNQEAFICFNQYPFNPQSSTYEKFMIMESMLKTIKDAKLGITHIRLLIHHQPLLDDHLNFNISWPIQGYLQN